MIWFFAYVAAGAGVGVLAGLLGIGGGIGIVCGLVSAGGAFLTIPFML